MDLFLPVELQVSGLEEFIFGNLLIGTEGARKVLALRKQLALKPDFSLRDIWKKYIDVRKIGKAGLVQISEGLKILFLKSVLLASHQSEVK